MDSDKFFAGVTLLSLLTIVGAAGKWLWKQFNTGHEKREARLEEREQVLDEQREDRIKKLEAGLAEQQTRLDELVSLVGRQRTAIHLLVAKIARDEPAAPELMWVQKLLGTEFPVILQAARMIDDVPQDMRDALAAIDLKTGTRAP